MDNHPGVPTQPKRSVGAWFGGLSRTTKLRLLLLAAVVVIAPFAIYAGLDEPNNAKVGDCMTGENADDLRKVDCTDAAARWKVLARLEGKTEADHNEAACAAQPETAASFYQDGRRFRKGFILCLGEATSQ